MTSRERGNLWPVISVIGGACFVLIVMPLIFHRQATSRMATVDAQVSIGDSGSDVAAQRNAPNYRWPDSEVPRTAERIRDLTAVAIAASSNVVEGVLNGRTPHDAGEILSNIAQRQLIPAEWMTKQSGVLQMPRSTIHLRYSPKVFSIEVISVPNDRADGPALLIRIPDQENTTIGPRYFESLQLDGIVYPIPFAPIPEIIASGWQPRPFKQSQIPDAERAQLEQWARTAINK